jgi:uncharacterized protein YbjT (DUF2867 family)
MILVTGAAGNSGSQIVRALSVSGVGCRALVRDIDKVGEIRLPKVEIVAGDLLDPASLDAAMKGVDKLMLIGPPVEKVAEMEAIAVAAAKRGGVKHIVNFSAMGVDMNPPVRFGKVHGESEKNIRASGLAWTFLRPSFFMQNLLGMAGMVKGGTMYLDAGDGKAGFIDLADVAAVAAKALTTPGHEGKIYELTGPELLSYGDIAGVFTKLLGKPVGYVKVPHAAARDAMTKGGVPLWQAEGVTELSEAMSQGKFAYLTDSVEKVAGRKPKGIEVFLRENLAIFG